MKLTILVLSIFELIPSAFSQCPDSESPTASNPAEVYIAYNGEVPAPDPQVVTDQADNNGDPIVTWESDVSDGQTCPETITRTYRVTDVC